MAKVISFFLVQIFFIFFIVGAAMAGEISAETLIGIMHDLSLRTTDRLQSIDNVFSNELREVKKEIIITEDMAEARQKLLIYYLNTEETEKRHEIIREINGLGGYLARLKIYEYELGQQLEIIKYNIKQMDIFIITSIFLKYELELGERIKANEQMKDDVLLLISFAVVVEERMNNINDATIKTSGVKTGE
jgi:hypothetical protein